MKKLALLIALMLMITTITFADDMMSEPFSGPIGAPTVSGSVTLVVGYDLDSKASGFDNSTDLTLRFPLADGADTKGGDDDIYGEITIDGIGWYVQPGEFYDSDEDASAADASKLDASISAKLVFGDAYVGLGAPGFSMNNVDVKKDYVVDANLFIDDNAKNWTDGMSAGYATDMFSVEVKIASKGNYAGPTAEDTDTDTVTTPFDNDTDIDEADLDTTPLNTSNQYVVGASVTVDPIEGVSIPVSVYYDMFAGVYGDGNVSLVGIGANPSVDIAPISVEIPVDVVMFLPDEKAKTAIDADVAANPIFLKGAATTMGIEVNPTITYEIIEGGSNVSVNFLYGKYSGFLVESPSLYGIVNALSELGVTIEETETDGFVDGLAATVAFALTDIMNYLDVADFKIGYTVDVDASYNLNGIKPYVNCGYGSDEVFDLGLGITLMADATGIDNTEITIDYTNEAVSAPDADDTEMGRVTATVKVSY